MGALAADEVLALWERGASRHALDRAALLVAAARPELAPEAIADLPLGAVTESLLLFRIAHFGERIASHVDCERCGESLEFTLDARALLAERHGAGPLEIEVAGLRLRAPCLRDLAAIARDSNVERAVRSLLAQCTLAGSADEVTGAALREVEDALEALDPNADLGIALTCVACGSQASAQLDAASLLWQEIEARARSLLREVHVLARAYGWGEEQILSLSASRRARYLAMVEP